MEALLIKCLKPAFPKLWVATHQCIMDAISMDCKTHLKFRLMHDLSQIIYKKISILILFFVFTVLFSKYLEVHVELRGTQK